MFYKTLLKTIGLDRGNMMIGINWLKQYLGYHEVKERKNLMALFKEYSIKNDIYIDPSTTPWCAVMVNVAERAVGNKGTGLQNARSFLKYGYKVAIKDAKRGDIVIFSRGGSTWQGHVAYLEAIEGNLIKTLGGNQSDAVTYGWYPKTRLLGIRRS